MLRDVAQPGRVHVWGACGRRFESCHPDNSLAQLSDFQIIAFFLFPRHRFSHTQQSGSGGYPHQSFLFLTGTVQE